jgi:hypothetical protein
MSIPSDYSRLRVHARRVSTPPAVQLRRRNHSEADRLKRRGAVTLAKYERPASIALSVSRRDAPAPRAHLPKWGGVEVGRRFS